MNIYVAALVIFLTAAVTMLGTALWLGRKMPDDTEPAYQAIPRPQPLSVAGLFPVDTGPLLILSEKNAANAQLEREIKAMVQAAEAAIPPRWRDG